MSAQRIRGRRAQQFRAFIIARDNGICWICGQPGADTIDHTPYTVDERPDLQFNPANARAAHGRKRPEYNCPGNYSLGITYENTKRKTQKTKDIKPSRQWITNNTQTARKENNSNVRRIGFGLGALRRG